MKKNQYEKIEAYEGLLEELKLQLLELSVARDLARRMEATLRQRLQKPSPPHRRLYYHKPWTCSWKAFPFWSAAPTPYPIISTITNHGLNNT